MTFGNPVTNGQHYGRYYVYIIKHKDTPIYIGMGSGQRYEIKGHVHGNPVAKREYILRHLNEITSEILIADLTWTEAAEKESDLISEYGLLCEATGPLLNRTYGAGRSEAIPISVRAENTVKRRNAFLERTWISWLASRPRAEFSSQSRNARKRDEQKPEAARI